MARPMDSLPKLDQTVRHPVDMSPEAIAKRIARCAEISELCMKLKEAGGKSGLVLQPESNRANAPGTKD